MLADYPLIRPLGTGGLGVVYLTEDPWSGRRIAIKQSTAAPHAGARLLAEHNILSALTLPVVPCCGRVGVLPGGSVYLTMEHIRGRGTLATARRAGRPGSPRRVAAARRLLRGLLRALVELHRVGVLHGDLKTRNMRLDASGAIRLLDFGAARWLDPRTQQADGSRFMGTLRYAAPEQRDRQPLDVRADLFSAGALTVRLLTDEKPDWPPTPPALPTDRPLARLLSALLALDPADRPASAAEALAMLPGTPPPLASWWPGSALIYTDPDPARRQQRRAGFDDADAPGVVIAADGATLEAAIAPLLSAKTAATLRIRELHTADPAARAALARLLRRSQRLGLALQLRATAAPDPTLRGALPLAAFSPIPAPCTAAELERLLADGALLEVLAHARGADPMLPGERHRIHAAIECWRALGQPGEAARLIRTLRPLQGGHERVLAASVALARQDTAAAIVLAREGGEAPRAMAIRWLAGDLEAQRPAGRWGALCQLLRGEIVDITDWPEDWRLEASARRGAHSRAREWLAQHGLAAHPEAEGGLRALALRQKDQGAA